MAIKILEFLCTVVVVRMVGKEASTRINTLPERSLELVIGLLPADAAAELADNPRRDLEEFLKPVPGDRLPITRLYRGMRHVVSLAIHILDFQGSSWLVSAMRLMTAWVLAACALLTAAGLALLAMQGTVIGLAGFLLNIGELGLFGGLSAMLFFQTRRVASAVSWVGLSGVTWALYYGCCNTPQGMKATATVLCSLAVVAAVAREWSTGFQRPLISVLLLGEIGLLAAKCLHIAEKDGSLVAGGVAVWAIWLSTRVIRQAHHALYSPERL